MAKKCKNCFNLKTVVLRSEEAWNEFLGRHPEFPENRYVDQRFADGAIAIQIFFCEHLDRVFVTPPQKAEGCEHYDG